MTTVTATAELATGKHCRCWKCSGSGTLDWAKHVANGVCFACGGSGKQKAGNVTTAEGIHTFVVDGLVWQFMPIHHHPDSHWTAKPGESVDSVLFHVFKLGANRYKGTTILQARVSPETGREVWKAAKSGTTPQELAAGMLAELKGTCAISENRRGVNVW